MRALVFDTETGGLDSRQYSLLSIGIVAVDLDSGEILEKIEMLHKLNLEEYKVSKEAMEINKISLDECVEKGYTTQEISDKFMDMYYNHNCSLLAGHNIDFDIRFVARQVFKVEPEALEASTTYRKVDTSAAIRLLNGLDGLKNGASLKQTVSALSIDMSDMKGGKYHTALYDAVATAKILCKFRKVFNDPVFIERLKN
jgi:DNA polymerase III alpha subunit (gram-positive type)